MNEEELLTNNVHFPLIIAQFQDNYGKIESFKALKDCKVMKSYDSWLWYNNAELEEQLLEISPPEWNGWWGC